MIQTAHSISMNDILATTLPYVSPPRRDSFRTTIITLFHPRSWINNPDLCEPMKQAVQGLVQTLLLGAIQTRNIPFIWVLKQRKADFNTIIEDEKQTPLGAAVLSRDPRVVTFVIDSCGANPDGEDEEGNTALDMAIRLRDPRIVHLLQEKGANIDHIHVNGQTSLSKAVETSDSERVHLLHRFGADLDRPDADGCTPLAWAYCRQKKDIAHVLVQQGADSLLAREILLVKSLAAIWGLGSNVVLRDAQGKKREIALEGFCPTYTYPMFLQGIELFLSHQDLSGKLQAKEKEALLRAWKEGCADMEVLSTSELLRKVHSQHPFIAVQDLSECEHVIGILFARNAMMICNRGHDEEKRDGVEIYSLDTSHMTPSMVEQFQNIDSMSDQSKWLKALKESALKMRYSGLIEQKPQNAGNCTWTSLESLFLALLYTILEERIPEEKQRKAVAHDIYKQFTAFVRVRMLDSYLLASKQPSKDLLEAILEKIDFKTAIAPAERDRLSSRMRETCESIRS